MSPDFGFCYPEAYQQNQTDLDLTLAGMKAVGCERVRIAVPWAQTQTAAGVYTWTAVDRAVAAIVAHGMKPLLCMAVLLYRPNNQTPVDFGNFCAATAAQYKSVCTDYEIHNEENSSAFFGASVDPAAYTAHLKAANIGIKNVFPGATVILGGMAPQGLGPFGFSMDPAEFLKGVYAAGGKGFFDAVANHPYSITPGFAPEAPSATQHYTLRDVAVHQVMVDNGQGSMKIWETEFGFPSSVVGDINQRDYTATQTAILLGNAWTGPIFFYDWRNLTADLNASESTFGAVTNDYKPKPVRAFYATLNPGATVALAGAGALRAVAGSRPVSALSGGGTMTAVAVPNLMAPAALSGGGTLAAELFGRPRAPLASEGTLVATSVPGFYRTAPLSGSGSIASVVIPTYPPRPAALSGSGTLTAIASQQADYRYDFGAAPSTKPTTLFTDFGQGYVVNSGVADNTPIASPDGAYFSGGIYKRNQFSADHFAEIVQSGFPTGDRSVAPIVRSNPAGTELVAAFGHWGGSRSLQIVTLMGGVLKVQAVADGQFQTTNRIRLTARGNAYTLSVDGDDVLTWVDRDNEFTGAANTRTGFGFEHRTVFGGTYDAPGINGVWRGVDLLPSIPVTPHPAALSGNGALTATAAARAAATLAGSGALSATVSTAGGQNVALAGAGTLSSAVPGAGATTALSGIGAIASAVVAAGVVPAALSGSGTLTAQTNMGSLQPASLAGSGALTATAVAAVAGPLTGSGALTATSTPGATAAALTGSGAIASSVGAASTSALAGAGSLTGIGNGGFATTAALGGSGSLTATAVANAPQAAALSGSGAIASVTGTQGAAPLSGAGSLTAAVPSYLTAPLSGAGTLTASTVVAGQVALSGSGALTATVPTYVTAALAGEGTIAVTNGAVVPAALSGSGSLSATVVPGRAVPAALSGSGTITAALASAAAAALSGSGTLTASVPAAAVSYSATGAAGQGTVGFATTISTAPWNQVTSAASEVILAAVTSYSSAGSITGDTVGCTCDGTAMTLVSSTALNGSGTVRLDVFKATVTAGTHALVGKLTGTVNGGREIVGNSESFQAVTTVQAGTIAQGTGTAPSITRTGGSTGERVFVAVGATATTLSAFSGGTQRYSGSSASSNAVVLLGDCAGASSVTAGATSSNSVTWACISVRLTP